ncbi:uncharacterized protein B0H18DRAFT_984914 [Fomitopsis serialis]|uniref:uncharacterized protein n=1 Tax=Fomitopsis serialis TaxID=139415 RepID=UPI0020076C04|nr:uncharacterized protein B0H18DRAFT_984914 [Neoantrodia serialis]KAH9932975.1 hypothetical protein B0H18DRAFT_984914 [Neoantrodia serialis]
MAGSRVASSAGPATATPDRLFPRIGIRCRLPDQPRPSLPQMHRPRTAHSTHTSLCSVAGQLTGRRAANGQGRDRGILAEGPRRRAGTEAGAEKRAATCRPRMEGRVWA